MGDKSPKDREKKKKRADKKKTTASAPILSMASVETSAVKKPQK